jgi:hypothetical protein
MKRPGIFNFFNEPPKKTGAKLMKDGGRLRIIRQLFRLKPTIAA